MICASLQNAESMPTASPMGELQFAGVKMVSSEMLMPGVTHLIHVIQVLVEPMPNVFPGGICPPANVRMDSQETPW